MESESTMTNDSGSSPMTNSHSLPVFYNPNAIMAHTHLTKENYVNWSTLFKTLLRAHKLLFVINTNPPPKTLADGKENPDHDTWKNATDLICCWIKGTVTPAIQPYLNSYDTAPTAWNVLAMRFGSTSAIQIENLQDRLHNLKKPTDLSVSDYLLQAKTISDSLIAAGKPLEDYELIQRILGGLGAEFKEFLTSTSSSQVRQSLNLDDLTELLLKEEMLQKKFAIPVEQATALTATKTSSSQPQSSSSSRPNNNGNGNRGSRGRGNSNFGRVRNQGRGNWGGQQWNNSYSQNSRNNRGGRGGGRTRGSFRGGNPHGRGILATPFNLGHFPDQNAPCQLCYQYGHDARVCAQRNNAAYFSQSEPYVLDSGATNHMTPDPSNFSEYSPYTGKNSVTFGNGTSLPISYIGKSFFLHENRYFKMNNVLFIPKLHKPLLSIRQFSKDNNCFFELDWCGFRVKDIRTREILLSGHSSGGLYQLSFNPNTSHSPVALLGERSTPNTWHDRLGHPSFNVFKVLCSKFKLPINGKLSETHSCHVCPMGKSSKLAFVPRNFNALHPLDMLHLDVWGPAPVQSMNGHRFYLSIIDDFSRYVWLFPLFH